MPSLFFTTLTLALAAFAQAAAPVNQLVGYGAGTTGGGSAAATTVTTCAAFKAAALVGGNIKISGTLSGCGIVDIKKSNTSVIGVGSTATIKSGGIRIRQASNVIIRNIIFDTAPSKGDLLALDEATKVWIDHNEFKSIGLVGGKDDYDGLLDITHASDYVTVSWNTFSDHWKGSLVGHSDSNASEDTGHLRVTYHHNLWTNVNSRTPSIRFGTGHIYNSVYNNVPTSGINSRMGAQVLVESSIFENVALAIVTDLDSDEDGYAVQRNNVFTNSPTEITKTGSLSTVPYTYTLDATSSLESILAASAGVGIVA